MRTTITYLLFLALAVALILTQHFDTFANDPGVGWHLLTGQYIFENGSVPLVDPFLHHDQPRQWIADQWLGDLLIFLFYDFGSWALVYVILAICYLATFFLVSYKATYRYTFAAFASALAAFFAFKLGSIHLILRPLIFAHLLFAIVFSLLLHFYEGLKAGVYNMRKLYICLPPVFLLWANIHPSFVLGLALIGSLLFALIADKFFLNQTFPSRITSHVTLILITCALVTLLNPYGFSLHHSILTLGSSEYFMNLNSEWHSLNFKEGEGRLVLSLIALCLISVRLLPSYFAKIRFFEVFSLLAFLVASFTTVRILPFLAIVSMPIVALSLKSIFDFSISKLRPKQQLSKPASKLKFLMPSFYIFSIITLILTTLSGSVPGYNGTYGQAVTRYPFKVLELLKQEEPSNSIVYSTPDWGGFLSFYGKGKIKALIDDRNTLLGEAAYRNYFELLKANPEAVKIIKKLGATHLLLPKDSLKPIDCFSDFIKAEGGTLIYKDELFLLWSLSL